MLPTADNMESMKAQLDAIRANLTNPSVTSELLEKCTDRISVLQSQAWYIQNNLNVVDGFRVVNSSSGGYNPLATPAQEVKLRKENLVGLKEMKRNVNKVLSGKVFYCRTIAPASKVVAVETSVEDREGKGAVRLSLYNFSPENVKVGVTDFEEVLPTGAYLAVKNPWFKSTASGGLSVRCDSPAEVEILSEKWVVENFPDWGTRAPWIGPEMFLAMQFRFPSPFWTRLPSMENERGKALKDLGNKAFVTKRFTDAVRWYDLSLEYCEKGKEEVGILLTNKAAALIGLNCWNAALKCLEAALSLGHCNEKVMYRKAKCLMGLEKYEEARDWLEDKMLTLESNNKDLEKLLDEVKGVKTMTTNMSALKTFLCQLQFSKNKIIREEAVPEVRGPIRIASIPGKGRGVIANEVLQAGQILVVTKAFANIIEPKDKKTVYTSTNFGSKQGYTNPCHDKLVGRISNMIHFDSKLGADFYFLNAGSELGHLEKTEKKNTCVDMRRIDKVVSVNAFAHNETDQSAEDEMLWNGVWLLPSLFNHSCSEANCTYNVVGNIMIVKAVKKVEEGEELFLPYVSLAEGYERRKAIHKSHDFICNCRQCALDAAPEDPKIEKKRTKLLTFLKTLKGEELVANPGKLWNTVKLIQEVERARKGSPDLNNFILLPGFITVSSALFTVGNFRECKALLLKRFEIAEINPWCMFEFGISTAVNIIRCLIAEKDEKGIIQWIGRLKELLITVHGSLEPMHHFGAQTLTDLKNLFDIDFFN